MTRIKLVTFNGPIGCGKSWVCEQLQKKYAIHGILDFPRVSFQDALREATYILLGVGFEVPYDEFKKTIYHGHTGREWMIHVSERSKELFETLFTETMLLRIKRRPNISRKQIFLADSNGFPSELLALRSKPDVDLLSCSIEPPGSPERGELWTSGDSRYNLAHMCTLVAPDSNAMLDKVELALSRRGWI
jgi:hypothetical protein